MTMKKPSLYARDGQIMLDAGVNYFAVQLLAESWADNPEKFGDKTAVLVAPTHSGQPVYIIISTQLPDEDQFKDWPESPA